MSEDVNELHSLQDHLAFFISLAWVKRPNIFPSDVVMANRTIDIPYVMASGSHLPLLHLVSKGDVDDAFKQIGRASSAMESLYIYIYLYELHLMPILAKKVKMCLGNTVPKHTWHVHAKYL